MPTAEFEVTMIGQAAKNILDADRPLTLEEIFSCKGMTYGQNLSRTLQKSFLDKINVEGRISEVQKGGIRKWKVLDRDLLSTLASACPPNVKDDENMSSFTKAMDSSQTARIVVALRALKRLLASKSNGDSTSYQTRTSLFIAKKGDKWQEREVINKSWQGPFLDRLVDDKRLEKNEDKRLALYAVLDEDYIQGILDGKADPCIKTLLWPDDPCTIDHTNPPKEVKSIIENVQEKEHKEEKEAIIESKDSEETEETEDEEISQSEIRELVNNISKFVTAQNDWTDRINKLMISTSNDIAHLHSKMDKIHEENVLLKKAIESTLVILPEIAKMTKESHDFFNREESSMGPVRKRLGDLEKLAMEHRSSLESNNKLLRTGMSEVTSSLISKAAEVFVQQDNKEVINRISSVEQNVLGMQSEVKKTLEEVYLALEEARSENKKQSRQQIILQRMEAISGGLQDLQGVLADLPKS